MADCTPEAETDARGTLGATANASRRASEPNGVHKQTHTRACTPRLTPSMRGCPRCHGV